MSETRFAENKTSEPVDLETRKVIELLKRRGVFQSHILATLGQEKALTVPKLMGISDQQLAESFKLSPFEIGFIRNAVSGYYAELIDNTRSEEGHNTLKYVPLTTKDRTTLRDGGVRTLPAVLMMSDLQLAGRLGIAENEQADFIRSYRTGLPEKLEECGRNLLRYAPVSKKADFVKAMHTG